MGRLLGLFVVTTSLLMHPWSVEKLFIWDGHLSDWRKIAAVYALQAIGLTIGLLMLRRPLQRRPLVSLGLLVTVPLTLAGAWGTYRTLVPTAGERLLARVEKIENLIARLSADELPSLNKGMQNLELPDPDSRSVFASRVLTNDLREPSGPLADPIGESLDTRQLDWAFSENPSTIASQELELWGAFLERIDHFRNVKFYIIRGDFGGEDESRLRTEVGFAALAGLHTGAYSAASGKLSVLWQKTRDRGGDEDWQVTEWILKEFREMRTPELLFEDLAPRIAQSTETLRRLTGSLHEEMILRKFLKEAFEEPPHFQVPSADFHPGLSVVDIDRDGLDDIYVMSRWGKNILLHNEGDGTFRDIAPEIGLDIEDHCSSALFADFDNDGDTDVFIGRTKSRSLFLENQAGRFIDRSSEKFPGPLPMLVSSVSAADYNADGLLDIYVSTYAGLLFQREVRLATSGSRRIPFLSKAHPLLSEFLPEETALRLYHMSMESPDGKWDALPGPPNVLYRNLGDRFEEAPESPQVEGWSHTFQSTWSDWDQDGDPDLYLANDFGPNHLFRNDREAGFVDVTQESGTADTGFGMGASWGDYDGDGQFDLYVTNMFSKAGRRITDLTGDLGANFAHMARGNSLFRNQSGRFERVSGLEEPALLVERGDWGWAGQFADVDNDSWLDIYAPAGYYTAPDEIAIPEDT